MLILLPRSAPHIPAWLLRGPRGEEVVGAVLLPALARQHCLLPEGPRHRGGGGQEQDGQEDCHQILPPLVHPLHQAPLC